MPSLPVGSRIASRTALLLALAVCALGLLATAPAAQARDVVVFAAASLRNALDEVAADFTARTGTRVVVSYAGSAALARQIEQGAPADLFLSADVPWMDHLDEAGLIVRESRLDLLGNAIVLIAHGREALSVEIGPDLDLAGLLAGGRLAMADVAAVPAGRYGRAALESLGLWESVADRLAQAENVRAALALVARGEAPLGIVYATDAGVEDAVTVVGTFPPHTHPPIVYPLARLVESRAPEAAQTFADHLSGEVARAVFERYGFVVIE